MARVLWRLVPSLVVLLAVTRGTVVLGLLHGLLWAAVRLVHVGVLVSGGLSFWWLLRSYQLGIEQELHEQAWAKVQFIQRYRRLRPPTTARAPGGTAGAGGPLSPGATTSGAIGRTSPSTSGTSAPAVELGMLDAGFQLKVLKRLPIPTHLRTTWGLPAEVCEEIAAFVQLAVREYVSHWFQPISGNEDFPQDVRFLLADMFGALVARCLEIDSTEALMAVANAVELLRLHLGWFREAYAQLAEDHPEVFEDDPSDRHLRRRQELLAIQAQASPFLHPACATAPAPAAGSGTNGNKKSAAGDSPEIVYLRHVAAQLLIQLKPEFGQQCDTNLFVSMILHLLRESLVFRGLKPLFEYALPRYANEMVLSALKPFLDDKDTEPLSPAGSLDAMSPTPTSGGLGFSMPLSQLNAASIELTKLRPLRATRSFLYKASKRSSEQAEAAFQAVMDAVSTAATSAGINSTNPTSPIGAEILFGDNFWSESAAFGIVSPRSPGPASPTSAPSSNEKRGHFASIFSLEDRITFPKTARLIPGRAGSGASKGDGAPSSTSSNTPMDDLKHMKANFESSLNSSIFKVKKTFRNIGGHLQDPVGTTTQAANLIKRPGKLFQKALRRGDANSATLSPAVPPNELPSTPTGTSRTEENVKELQMQDRVLLLLDKTIGNFVKMHNERPEMRSSARSRELYELLSAIEDIFMVGYRKPGVEEESGEPICGSNFRSDNDGDGQTASATVAGLQSTKVPDISDAPTVLDPSQLYWNYLAQERPETPFLNDHWKFIASQCPLCGDSESFFSTRGVQWILIALEKGMLWEFVTALHLNRRLTEQFYEDHAVLRNGRLMEKVLKALFPLNKLRVIFEIPHLLGRKHELEQELGVSGVRSARPATQAVRVVETVWEVERYVPIHGWVKSQDKRSKELPSSEWIWENQWTLESPRVVDGNAGSDSSDNESRTWQYAKTFDDRFHDKEKKFDSVRRRKWTRRRRQLPFVLSVPTTSLTTPHSSAITSPSASGIPISPTSVLSPSSTSSSPRRGSSRQPSLGDDSVDSSPKRPHSPTLSKRRSSSNDAIGDVADYLRSSTTSPPLIKKKRSSNSSLKRANSALTKAAAIKARSDALNRSTLSDDDMGCDAEVDDEANLCFRCLKPLATIIKDDRCQSCQQRCCSFCLDFFAFMVYPPPLETTKKEQVCGSCYDRFVMKYKLKVDAHVSKYLIKMDKEKDRETSDPCSPSSFGSNGGGSGKMGSSTNSSVNHHELDGSQRYEITVQLKDESTYAWSAVKSFGDFEALEKELNDKLKKQEKKHGPGFRMRHWKGVDYSEILNVEPTLKALPPAALSSYEKRLFVLEEYLQRILQCDTLCQSSVVQSFLLLNNANGVGLSGSLDKGEISMGTSTVAGSGSGSGVTAAALENGRYRRGKWIAPEANTKETKMKSLQKLEVSLFAILQEVFEFDGIGMVRRQLVSMSRSFIKAFLNASHFRKLEKQYLSILTDPKKMAATINSFRMYMFPDVSPEVPPVNLSSEEMQELRKNCLEAILASFPPAAVSLFGEISCENASLKLHEFLQHEVFVKNLMFSLCDEFVHRLFPDAAPFVPRSTRNKSN